MYFEFGSITLLLHLQLCISALWKIIFLTKVQAHHIYLAAEMIMKVKTEMININTRLKWLTLIPESLFVNPTIWDSNMHSCADILVYKSTVTSQDHMTGGNNTCLDTAQSIETKGQILTVKGTWRAAMHDRPVNANNVTLRGTITQSSTS